MPTLTTKPRKKTSRTSSNKASQQGSLFDAGTAAAAGPAIPDEAPIEPAKPAPRKKGRKGKTRTKETAASMAARQREISVSEFFTKNRTSLPVRNRGTETVHYHRNKGGAFHRVTSKPAVRL